VLTGLLGAFAAAVLYGAATVLQAAGVRSLRLVPAGASLPARLWAGRLYAVGLGLDGLGFLASIAALRTLPLFVVQSAIASSVAVTALLAVLFLGARLERREVLALAVVGLGLLALALSATDEPAVRLGPGARWVVLAGVVPVAAVALAGLTRRGPRSAVLLATASGLGFGGVGVASRVLVVPDRWVGLLLSPTAWAILAYAAVALVCYGLALDRGTVTTTAAVTFAVETVVPSAIGLLLLHDRVRAGYPVVAALGFAATLGGCIALARLAEPPSDDERPGGAARAGGAGPAGPSDAGSKDLRPSG
jgi:drug/metabolite transporter (DMT)-like permease